MNDTDKIAKEIMISENFRSIRASYMMEEKSRNENSVTFQLIESRFQSSKNYFMTAEIINVVENMSSESPDAISYRVMKINQRIHTNMDISRNCPGMVKYLHDSMKLFAFIDTTQRVIYYIVYIYEMAESLATLLKNINFSYSTKDAALHMIEVCKTLKKCHEVNVYHNDISLSNIYMTSEGVCKLGKIDMKNFIDFDNQVITDNDVLITPETSLKNDICMVGQTLLFLCQSVSRKNQLLDGKITKIASKASKKVGGYKSVDDIAEDLEKAIQPKNKILLPAIVASLLLIAGGFFVVKGIAGRNIAGDINGDGKINQFDVNELNDRITNQEGMTKKEFKRCDINGDGKLNMIDVSCLLDYISYLGTSNDSMTLREYLKSQEE